MAEEKKVDKSVWIEDCWNMIGVWSTVKERCPELKKFMHCRNCPVYASVGRHLLDQEIPQEYISEWTSVFAKLKKEKQQKDNSAFIFRTGGEWLALPAKLIQEVVDMGVIHSLPHRNSTILRGVVNIRGKMELCFSIGAVLGIERFRKVKEKNKKYLSPPRLVVAERNGQRIVFPVSEIYGSFRYGDRMLQPLPVTVSGSRAAFTKGVLTVDDFDVGLLDDAILYEAFMRNV